MKNNRLAFLTSLFLAFCVILEVAIVKKNCTFTEVRFFFTWVLFTEYGVKSVGFFLIPLLLNVLILGYGLFRLLSKFKYQKILFLCAISLFSRIFYAGVSIPINDFSFFLLKETAGYQLEPMIGVDAETSETRFTVFYIEKKPITVFTFGTLGAVINGVFRPATVINDGGAYESCQY
jgi:hypothetical protein